jgi:fluoride exporter
MNALLGIFIGGGIGSLARYGLSLLLNPQLPNFPLGTFAANVLACVVVGLVAGLVSSRPTQPEWLRLSVVTGFCGGFSTFSTFSMESITLLQSERLLAAMAYVGLSLLACMIGVLAGTWIGRTA